MLVVASAVAALALAAAPETAPEAAQAAPSADSKPAADASKAKPKKVCYESTVTNSRLARKTCVTVAPSKAPKGAAREAEEDAAKPPAA